MWDTIKGMFTGSIGGLVEKTGAAIDRLVTSDAERLALKNELAEIQKASEQQARKHAETLEAEISARHKADMKSDSWLSKNVRPLTLIFLTVAVTALAYITTFTEVNDAALKQWIELFTYLLGLVYGFYFGSRGLEKVASIIGKRNK